MFFRRVISLVVACTVGTYCSYLRADGFWDLQTLADDASYAQAPAYYVPTHNAQESNAPTNHMPAINAPMYKGTAFPPPAFMKRPVANPEPIKSVDHWKSYESVQAASINGMANRSGDVPMPPASKSLAYTQQYNPAPTRLPPASRQLAAAAPTHLGPAFPVPPPASPAQAPAYPAQAPSHSTPAPVYSAQASGFAPRVSPFPAPETPSDDTPSSASGATIASLDGKALASAIYGVGTHDVIQHERVFQPVVGNSCWGQQPIGQRLGRMYGGVEYLHWWTRGQRLPVLVTSSLAGTPDFEAGVWGFQTTEILYGGDRIDADDSPGGRFYLGINLDCDGCSQIEAEYFLLDRGNFNFAVASPVDYTIIARPFYNTFLGQEDAELVGYPGIVDGAVSVRGRTNFDGFGVWYRHNLLNVQPTCMPAVCDLWGPSVSGPGMMCSNPSPCGAADCGAVYGCATRRLDLIMGYRRLDLDESLRIDELLTSTDPSGPIPQGTTLDIQDRFRTKNEFNGGDFGLDWEWSKGCWGVGALFKCAIGNVRQRVRVDGSSAIFPPAGASAFNDGGLLALDSNSGNYERDEFTVIPEVGLDAHYQLSCNVRLTVGYTLIYFANVLRPGDQIDTNVDPQQLPPPLITNGRFPELKFYEDDFWAQGLRLGAEFAF
jgi:hypothetical protein